MYFRFGKKRASAPPPDIAGHLPSSAFGRYLRYGRRSLFGRRYFGFGNRYPMFGKKKPSKMSEEGGDEGENEFGRRRFRFGSTCGANNMVMSFGRRRSRKGTKKSGRKPPASLIRACKKYGIKCTRKVGRRRVYKKVSVLKKQLRRKRSAKRRKNRKHRSSKRKANKKVRRRKNRSTRRRARFGSRRRVSLFGLKF